MPEFIIGDNLGNARDSSGRTLLHHAAETGRDELAKHLISRGCNVNAQDNEGMTPLMLSVTVLDDGVVNILLDAKADIYIENNSGKNVLQLAFMGQSEPRSIVSLLRKVQDMSSCTEEIVTRLIEADCPLYWAVLLENTAVTRRMIELGIEIEAKDPYRGWTALYWAVVESCDSETVKLLLDYKANVNAMDNGDFNTVARLLEENVTLDIRVDYSSEKLKILKLLIDAGASLTSTSQIGLFQVWRILFDGCSQAVKMVLQSDIDFTAKDNYEMTILNYIVQNENSGVIEVLKDYIHKFDVNARNTLGDCALFEAVVANNPEAVKLLLDNGAEVNCVDCVSGETPLFKCFPIEIGKERDVDRHDECVEILLEYGADPQITSLIEKAPTIFDAAQFCGEIQRLKLVIARLAMLERLGTKLTELTRVKIESNKVFKEYFESCECVLRFKIYESTDLFELLTVDERKLASHLSDVSCLRRLILFSDVRDIKSSHKYYYNTMKKRIMKIVCMNSVPCECDHSVKIFKGKDMSKLLVVNEKILARDFRCANYLREFMPVCYDTIKHSRATKLKRLIVSIVYKTELMDEATVVLSKIFGWRINSNHLVLSEIISYLDLYSLKSLACLSEL